MKTLRHPIAPSDLTKEERPGIIDPPLRAECRVKAGPGPSLCRREAGDRLAAARGLDQGRRGQYV